MTVTGTEVFDVGRLVEPREPSRVVFAAMRIVDSYVVAMGERQQTDCLFYVTGVAGTYMLHVRVRVSIDARTLGGYYNYIIICFPVVYRKISVK